jgi:hypothetical protein
MRTELVTRFIGHYDSLTELQYNYSTHKVSSVFTSPLLGSGFQRHMSHFLWVPELPPASAASFTLLTAFSTPPPHGCHVCQSQSFVTTEGSVGQSVLE